MKILRITIILQLYYHKYLQYLLQFIHLKIMFFINYYNYPPIIICLHLIAKMVDDDIIFNDSFERDANERDAK